METAINHVANWMTPHHAATLVDQFAWELAGEGEAAFKVACDTLQTELSRQLPEPMAIGLTAEFASMVRERLAQPKH